MHSVPAYLTHFRYQHHRRKGERDAVEVSDFLFSSYPGQTYMQRATSRHRLLSQEVI